MSQDKSKQNPLPVSLPLPRRTVLRAASAGAASWAMAASARSYAAIKGANDRVNVGLVGFADRAKGDLMPAFFSQSKELNFELIGLSDIWKLRREEGVAHFQQKYGKTVKPYRNNDELYDDKDIDAVFVVTADFQHAAHAIEAVKAGRDAYVEKPLANKMQTATAVLKAVESSKQIVQVGTQRRSSPIYQQANDYIRSGKFGDVVAVELTWNVNQPGRWRRPALVAQARQEDTDWKRYLVGMPYEAWDPRKYVEYRLFWPYSTGIPCQWMVHQIDTIHWFTGLSRPRSVVANGGIYLWKDGRKNYDTVTAVFDYGPLNDKTKGGFQVIFSSRQTNEAGSIKEMYYSNGGTLNLDTGMVSPEGGLTEEHAKKMDMKPNQLEKSKLVPGEQPKAAVGASTGADAMTTAHVRNWMECVRSRRQPNAPVRVGYDHSVTVCMVKAALDTGRRVSFDDKKQVVVTS